MDTLVGTITPEEQLVGEIDSEQEFIGEIAGQTGVPGKSAYVHIKYANVEPTSNEEMSDVPSNSEWIGIYAGDKQEPPVEYTEYTWNKVKLRGEPFEYEDFTLEQLALLKGEQGIQGIQGEKGEKGDRGLQGIQGEQGIQGIQGERGLQGIQGEQGIQGDKGDKGDTGNQGLKGDTGSSIISSAFSGDNIDFIKDDTSIVTLSNAKVILKGEQGVKGDKGDRGNTVHVKYSDIFPTQDEDMIDSVSNWMGVYVGDSITPPTSYLSYQWYVINAIFIREWTE
jgi:hypothetical protein